MDKPRIKIAPEFAFQFQCVDRYGRPIERPCPAIIHVAHLNTKPSFNSTSCFNKEWIIEQNGILALTYDFTDVISANFYSRDSFFKDHLAIAYSDCPICKRGHAWRLLFVDRRLVRATALYGKRLDKERVLYDTIKRV